MVHALVARFRPPFTVAGVSKSGRQLLDEVRQVLATAGFTEPDGGTGGLVLRAKADGVLIAWQPAEVVRAVTYVHRHEDALDRLTSLPGLHQAIASALAAILDEAGLPGGPHAVGRTGRRPPADPEAHAEEITVEGEAQPVIVKLGVWISNTKPDATNSPRNSWPRSEARGGVGKVGGGYVQERCRCLPLTSRPSRSVDSPSRRCSAQKRCAEFAAWTACRMRTSTEGSCTKPEKCLAALG